jgi:hypothetical protein
MTGTALIGQPRFNTKQTGRRFEPGKSYASSDGTAKAVIGNVRRGKYSSRVLAQIENEWAWYEIGHSGGTELFTAETKRGVYVIMAGRERL